MMVMKEITCIICPNGCSLTVKERDGMIEVSGNRCKRGESFAISELKNPMRTICSTVRTTYTAVPVIPVRVSAEIPKKDILLVMQELGKIVVETPVGRGAVLIKNVLGLEADVIVTSNILKESVEGVDEHEHKTV